MECLRLSEEWEDRLYKFFECLVAAKDDQYFHPHPFTKEEAHKKAIYAGKDYYSILTDGSEIIGYGMLRGWDEGCEVPSLGIAIHPDYRSKGMGLLLMQHLHKYAKAKKSPRIMLKVYPTNIAALRLYKKLGYQFDTEQQGQLVGFYDF